MFFVLCFAYGNHVDPEDSDLIRLFSHALFLCDQNNLQVHRYTLKYAVKFLPTCHSFAVALSSSLEYAFFLSVLSRGNYLNFLRVYISALSVVGNFCFWPILHLGGYVVAAMNKRRLTWSPLSVDYWVLSRWCSGLLMDGSSRSERTRPTEEARTTNEEKPRSTRRTNDNKHTSETRLAHWMHL